jgi:hypothetical protein
MKKAFIRLLNSIGLGKSIDIEEWAKKEYQAVLTPNPIAYKSPEENEHARVIRAVEEMRESAKRMDHELHEKLRTEWTASFLAKVDALKERPLTVDERLELDQLLYGTAYYRTIEGVKERIDPMTLTILHGRHASSRISPLPTGYITPNGR